MAGSKSFSAEAASVLVEAYLAQPEGSNPSPSADGLVLRPQERKQLEWLRDHPDERCALSARKGIELLERLGELRAFDGGAYVALEEARDETRRLAAHVAALEHNLEAMRQARKADAQKVAEKVEGEREKFQRRRDEQTELLMAELERVREERDEYRAAARDADGRYFALRKRVTA